MTGSAGRSITLHFQERLLQEARALQRSPDFRKEYALRIVVEHRIARLAHLGIRKSRYFGRRKTLFQLLMAAGVADFTLIANATGVIGSFVSSVAVITLFFTPISVLLKHEGLDNGLSAPWPSPAKTAAPRRSPK